MFTAGLRRPCQGRRLRWTCRGGHRGGSVRTALNLTRPFLFPPRPVRLSSQTASAASAAAVSSGLENIGQWPVGTEAKLHSGPASAAKNG